MLIPILQQLFKRDLDTLKFEIGAYKSESTLWATDGEIANSGGNLCLHLVGNINAFIGTTLGNTGYVRQRALEFTQKDVPKTVLIEQITATQQMVEKTLNQLSETDLLREYPIHVFKKEMTTGYFLTHLATHLTYHLGQVNYHRRLLDV